MTAIVQARMSSARFPGKVLAPFRGRPVIFHVVDAVRRALPEVPVAVATSNCASDDPLAAYVERLGVAVYRGSLDDVCARVGGCAAGYSSAWILRLCADSPLLFGEVLQALAVHASSQADIVTTTRPRSFPKGSNAELIRRDSLLALADEPLTEADREHVTAYFYRHPERYRIINVSSGDPSLAELQLAVDCLEDLERLESIDLTDVAERLRSAAQSE